MTSKKPGDPPAFSAPTPKTFPVEFCYAENLAISPRAFGQCVATANIVVADGDTAVCKGRFHIPKRTSWKRPLISETITIHRISDRFYARICPIFGSVRPPSFGRRSALDAHLCWRREPPDGMHGHPFYAAVDRLRNYDEPSLKDRLIPPDWSIHFENGDTETFEESYGAPYTTFDDDKPDFYSDDERRAAGINFEDERHGALIASGAEANVALIGNLLYDRIVEPCWSLSLTAADKLTLSPLIQPDLRAKFPHPHLVFPFNRQDLAEAAIERLRSAGLPEPRRIGEMAWSSSAATSLYSNCSSFEQLAICINEAIGPAAGRAEKEASDLRTAMFAAKKSLDYDRERPSGHTRFDHAKWSDNFERLLHVMKDEIRTDSASGPARKVAMMAIMLNALPEVAGRFPITPTGEKPPRSVSDRRKDADRIISALDEYKKSISRASDFSEGEVEWFSRFSNALLDAEKEDVTDVASYRDQQAARTRAVIPASIPLAVTARIMSLAIGPAFNLSRRKAATMYQRIAQIRDAIRGLSDDMNPIPAVDAFKVAFTFFVRDCKTPEDLNFVITRSEPLKYYGDDKDCHYSGVDADSQFLALSPYLTEIEDNTSLEALFDHWFPARMRAFDEGRVFTSDDHPNDPLSVEWRRLVAKYRAEHGD